MSSGYPYPIIDEIKENVVRAQCCCLLLDYDGTLVPFADDPDAALPDENLIDLLSDLGGNPKYRVIIISGRSKAFLQKCFATLPITLMANYGADVKEQHGAWLNSNYPTSWMHETRSHMLRHVKLYPQTFIEEKDYSLVWHYRKLADNVGAIASETLVDFLGRVIDPSILSILKGSKTIEVSSLRVNKGDAGLRFLSDRAIDHTIAIGDDLCDESLFAALPAGSSTIKIGPGSSSARYVFRDHLDVRTLLRVLSLL